MMDFWITDTFLAWLQVFMCMGLAGTMTAILWLELE
jgi:hypothetical protein